jgi:hypothetical protein
MRWKSLLVPAAFVLLSACGDAVAPCRHRSDPASPSYVVTYVIVIPPEFHLLVQQELQLQARAEDERRNRVMQAECTWSTADPTVVAVDSVGLAKGISPGSAAVTATCDGVTGSALLTVDPWILMFPGTGGALYDIGGSSATDIFSVGTADVWSCCGTIVHYDGLSWKEMAVPSVPGALLGVWVSSADDVFAVGEGGTILHYDGTTWAIMESGTTSDLGGIWGSSPTDVFAVGEGGTVLRYDGQSWSPMPVLSGSPFLSSIWGSSGTDVFAAGQGGEIVHYDGASWVEMYDAAFPLKKVWGSSATDVFAVGEWATVLHYDGASWKPMGVPTIHQLTGIWGTADNDIFVVGAADGWEFTGGPAAFLHYDGAGWEEMKPEIATGLLGVWGTSEDLFLVGSWSMVIRVTR